MTGVKEAVIGDDMSMQKKGLPQDQNPSGESLIEMLRKIGDEAVAEAINISDLDRSAAESLVQEGKAKDLEDAYKQMRETML